MCLSKFDHLTANNSFEAVNISNGSTQNRHYCAADELSVQIDTLQVMRWYLYRSADPTDSTKAAA